MANTYSQIYIQLIFAVKRREALIAKSWREDLFRYTTGVVQGHGQKLLAVGGVEDHIHIFFGYDNLMVKIPDLVRETKKATNAWVNDNRKSPYYFEWQDGYGAFSYSRSQMDAVCQYVLTQEEHHKTVTFREEYLNFLEKFEVPYDERYIFKFFDDKWIL